MLDRVSAGSAEWVSRAACRRADPELFFPAPDAVVSGAAAAAKAVCARCPVRAPCLAYALATGQQYGVWGGATEGERRAMARGGGHRVTRTVSRPDRVQGRR